MGRRKVKQKGIRCQIRVFQCDVCGSKREATKVKGRTAPGHQKFMYCVTCHEYTAHTQIE